MGEGGRGPVVPGRAGPIGFITRAIITDSKKHLFTKSAINATIKILTLFEGIIILEVSSSCNMRNK